MAADEECETYWGIPRYNQTTTTDEQDNGPTTRKRRRTNMPVSPSKKPSDKSRRTIPLAESCPPPSTAAPLLPYLDERESFFDVVGGGWNDDATAYRENGGEPFPEYRSEVIIRGFQQTPHSVFVAEYELQLKLITRGLYKNNFAGYPMRIATYPVFEEMQKQFEWLCDEDVPGWFQIDALRGWIRSVSSFLQFNAKESDGSIITLRAPPAVVRRITLGGTTISHKETAFPFGIYFSIVDIDDSTRACKFWLQEVLQLKDVSTAGPQKWDVNWESEEDITPCLNKVAKMLQMDENSFTLFYNAGREHEDSVISIDCLGDMKWACMMARSANKGSREIRLNLREM